MRLRMKIQYQLFLLLIVTQCISTVAFSAAEPLLFFTGVVGENLDGRQVVLLRWYTVDGPMPVQSFSIYRKQGDAASTEPMELVTVTEKLRNPNLIRSIFEQPSQARALQNLFETLNSIADETITPENYVQHLIAILDGEDECDQCEFRRNMLVQSNYGVAIVEGLGYVDLPVPGTYTYELRTSANGGQDNIVLGRITLDATQPHKLPAPLQPEFVDVPGEKAHLKVFLNWDISPALTDRRTVMFGYNVYRGEGDLSGQDFNTLLDNGQLQKINRFPVLPPSADALGAQPEDQYVFVDDNMVLERDGPVGEPFNAGDQYTYWVAAIDLLGQNGEASLPETVIVPDKSVPQVPRSLNTRVIEVGGMKRILLTWERNLDDTVSYEVYRFREWDHVGKKTPFPPVDGLTEGLVATIPQPLSDAPLFSDPDIQLPDHENMAFWYCVAAVDAWGNASAMSPPFRGVIFDTTPPNAPDTFQVCVSARECLLLLQGIEGVAQYPEQPFNTVNVKIFINKTTRDQLPENTETIIVERIITYNVTTHYVPPSVQTIFEGPYERTPGTQSMVIIDEFPRPPATTSLTYRITALDEKGRQCSSLIIPDEKSMDIFRRIVYAANQNPEIYVLLDSIFRERCVRVPSGGEPHEPFDENGNPNPVTFDFPKEGDAAGVILLRSPDCENYYPVVEEWFPDGASNIQVQDEFYPTQGGRICYGVRYFDENKNLSPIFYIPVFINFPTLPVSSIAPSLISAKPLGDTFAPIINLKWFGSNIGAAGFRVEMATAENFSGEIGSVQLSPGEYSYNDEDSEFDALIDRFDDASGKKIEIDKKYFIRIVALYENGQERQSNNSLSFIWSADAEPHEHPAWPIRSLPDTASGLAASWIMTPPNPANGLPAPPFSKGIGIFIGYLNHSNKENISTYLIEPPYIVYRQRVDKPDKPYIQISPLIEFIQVQDREVPRDPFFYAGPRITITDNFNIIPIYFLDTVDLIVGARYQYKFVKLNPDSGEIEKVFGPTNTVEVLNP
jgi:hypothetical protein